MREVVTDPDFRMDPDSLAEMILADRAAGLEPWLVVSSAGTTDLGNVDELDRIGAVTREHGLWFHVDGAYGGFFILCDLVKHRFRGIELSDSVVMNPHKGLHTPFGLGAALNQGRRTFVPVALLYGRLPAGPGVPRAGTLARGRKSRADPPFPRTAPVVAAQAHRRRPVPRHAERETAADPLCVDKAAVNARF